jgi:dihydrofolate reductase
MRKTIVITQLSVDGAMQAPGGPNEDPKNGFALGGWAMPDVDDALSEVLHEPVAGEFDMLLGRRTYDIFAAYWPKQAGQIARAFDKATIRQRATHVSHLSDGRGPE